MTRILVVFATTDGHTRKVAQRLDQCLHNYDSDLHTVIVEAGTLDVRAEYYDAVVVCASVHGGHYQAAVKKWVRTNAHTLNMTRTAFVSVCLGILQEDAKVDQSLDAIAQRFFEATGWQPTRVKKVAGALLYRDYNFVKRWIMKRIVKSGGGDTDTSRNYEYTDWDDLRAFAVEFAGLVSRERKLAHSTRTA